MAAERRDLWLPLLVQLTERFPGWAIWKNVASAFAGTGDVDSLAPPSDWPAIQAAFTAWCRATGLSPMIFCRHIPQGPHFIALQPGSPYIVQLDVKERATFRGSTLVDAWSLLALSELDTLGFRRVRPGVEGVIKLCMNGVIRGGLPNHAGLAAKGVAELLRADPAGVALGAGLMGPARDALLRGAEAVIGGGWDRAAMLTVEAWCGLRAATEPRVAASRWRFLRGQARTCPVLRVIREGERRVPADRQRWLAEVAVDHEVLATADR